jgi:hypothetical protein
LPLQIETEQQVTAVAMVVAMTTAVQSDPTHTQAISENIESSFMTNQIRIGQYHKQTARNGIRCLKQGDIEDLSVMSSRFLCQS